MKRCSQCQTNLPLTNFAINRSKHDGLQDECRDCKSIYNAEYYKRTKDRHNPGRAERREAATALNKKAILEYLVAHPCADCGNPDIRVLEFDHARGKKSFNVSTGMRMYKIERLFDEIAKCDVVCANCHRIRTYERKPSWRNAPLA